MNKNGRRLFLLAAIFLFFPLTVTQAGQDKTPLSGNAFYQTATTGSLTDNGDDSYTFTLEDVASNTVFIAPQPSLAIAQVDTALFARSWEAGGEDLSASAVIELDNLTIFVTLSTPEIDGHTLTYQAIIDDILPVGGNSGGADLEVPETVKTVNLLISGDDALIKAVESSGGTGQPSLTSGVQGNLTTGVQGNLTTGTGGASTRSVISYYQTATRGTFTAGQDGRYALKLMDVYPIMMSGSTTAPLGVLWVSTDQFAKAWQSGKAEVTANAVLALDKLRIAMTLSMPEGGSADHTLTYRAVVTGITPTDKNNKATPPLPTKFDTADLLIGDNTALASALTLGLETAAPDLTSGVQGNLTTGTSDSSDCQSVMKSLAGYLNDASSSGKALTSDNYLKLGQLNDRAGKACPVSSILLTPAFRRSHAPAPSAQVPPRRPQQ